MAARCASCSYPLSVSDSVSCCECLSYFHIDCAQLVGFPNYELSSDPNRNTFHCQTCKILPLPRQSISFSDSDSDDNCTMPSRQLDYHLEGQPDFAKDLNEVKGTVQDLSELCKDMFREINELKSINLTLRCCVENLRHDGEQRDTLLSQLKRRIEALEGKGSSSLFTPIESANMFVERISVEREEDPERYSTPDPEYSRLKEIDNLEKGNLHFEKLGNQITDETTERTHPKLESYNISEEKVSLNERITSKEWDPCENSIDTSGIQSSENTEPVGTHFSKEIGHHNNDEEVHFAEEEIISTTISKEKTESIAVGSVKDWDWKGNKAVQIKNSEDTNEISGEEEEEEENEASYIEETETPSWKIIGEDLKSDNSTKHVTEVFHSARYIREVKEEESEEETEEKKVTWADEVDKYNEEEELKSGEEDDEIIETSDDETQHSQVGFESKDYFQAEETEEQNEEAVEGADKTSLKEEEAVEAAKIEVDIDAVVEGGAEVEDYIKAIYTGRVDSAEAKPRLEGDAAVEEGAVPEGELAEGGQSPEGQGEVQPSELSEATEPPPPPPPQHTPDDLWEYLKETVTGEHPATVEEFVQKLIGTLEHVPEEYLKPVIDYNIKRANSPSVTDGEHLEGKSEVQQLEGETPSSEQPGTGEENPQQNGDVVLEGGDHTTSLPQGEAPLPEGDGLPSEGSAAQTTDFAEEPSEGYSAVEAPA